MMTPLLIFALLAPGAAPADGRGRERAAAAGERLLCRELTETGSRLAKKRICMTRDAWAEYKRHQRAELQRMQVNAGDPSVD